MNEAKKTNSEKPSETKHRETNPAVNPETEEPPLPDKKAPLNIHTEFFNRFPERITPDYLNNFYLNFHKTQRGMISDAIRKGLIKDKAAPDPGSPTLHLYSEKRKNMTMLEFYNDLDETARELGIKIDETFSYNDERLIPLYLALRRRGYSHYDLVH